MLVGNGENDSAVGVLQDVGVLAVVEPWHHDVAALDEPDGFFVTHAEQVVQHAAGPGTGGVHERTRRDHGAGTVVQVFQFGVPEPALTPRFHHACARADGGAALGGVPGIQGNEPRIFHPGVGINKAAGDTRFQRGAERKAREFDAGGGRQAALAGKVVIQEQADPDHPGRADGVLMRQHEAQRPDDVRRDANQALALLQRFAHEAEIIVFQVAQAAMDQLGGGG